MVSDNTNGTAAVDLSQLSKNESIKDASRYLRGTILEGLADTSTGALADDDTQLTKFHGIYQQDDRDVRSARRKAKQEPAYSFMIRVRVPGGVCTPQQWLQMDRLATTYGNDTLKLTTRQAFQLHGVIKSELKKTIQEINASLMDTIAACGDVNRNVMCNPNPYQSEVHAEALKLAQHISDHLTPRTRAYHEIWLTDEAGEKVQVTEDPAEVEPIYGKYYLPRKFKIVVAVPPSNDVDIYANDLGYIAILGDDGKIVGYNVTVGGGMGMNHGNEATYPRLAEVLGFCTPEQAVDVAEKVVTVQRDYGDRKERKHARLKYTIDDHGLDWFRDRVEERLGYKLGAERPFTFDSNSDRYGWVEDANGNSHLGLFIQNGRVRDAEGQPTLTGLREIAKIHTGDFRLSANQHLVIANITPEQRPKIEALLEQYHLKDTYETSGLRRSSMACVALPTCGLSLAESERYLPDLITELEEVIDEAGLRQDDIVIRMTGCPNGCARPYIAEIALVGRAPRKYNLYLGGGFYGQRLSKLYKVSVKAEEIVETLRPILLAYAQERTEGERFGDFVIRKGIVAETREGRDFHKDFKDEPASV
ncbi:MAG: NADPH-dependent assimilatory sulfite reductase hemoprotein subunit [Verrucomicrobia bacterium]|nr:NADPH-dependent assimilatory sulfite reductase hemoprotein subunit [Verrucomicrobiota bacterium]